MTIGQFEASGTLATLSRKSKPPLFVRRIDGTSDEVDIVLVDREGEIRAGFFVGEPQEGNRRLIGLLTEGGWENLDNADRTLVRAFAGAAIGFAAEETQGAILAGAIYDDDSDVPPAEVFPGIVTEGAASANVVRISPRVIREAIPDGFLAA